ncbi:MAG: NAD-dependent epimerase/dehydratase family protein [Verrucomicrobia bacterium]|nr:NAD-dependent epimerase/dehydratase family protein [Verrucomicrobiota bacterium]
MKNGADSDRSVPPLHTVLGAGGAIASEVTRELATAGHRVRLVSRRLHQGSFETKAADLCNYQQTLTAVNGSSVVYLCVGLKYDLAIWRAQWPVIMRNTIDACQACSAKLVFFDNVYMYGKVTGVMSEATPYNPCSRKGELRAQLAANLMEEVKAGNIMAMIARAADFYGPGCRSSLLNLLVVDRLAAGARAWWLLDDRPRHSFTFTPDVGKALVRLAGEESAYQKVWHLPTAASAPTGREWIERCAEALGRPAKRLVISKSLARVFGLFDKSMREVHEMLYQNSADYLFDSTKIENAFGLYATSMDEGVQLTVKALERANS